jgi:hypothetical protein
MNDTPLITTPTNSLPVTPARKTPVTDHTHPASCKFLYLLYANYRQQLQAARKVRTQRVEWFVNMYSTAHVHRTESKMKLSYSGLPCHDVA